MRLFCSVLDSDAGNHDCVVIQELIKTVAQSQQIQTSTQRDFKGKNVNAAYKLTLMTSASGAISDACSNWYTFILSGVANRGGQTH